MAERTKILICQDSDLQANYSPQPLVNDNIMLIQVQFTHSTNTVNTSTISLQ